jgi:hypothetical protein
MLVMTSLSKDMSFISNPVCVRACVCATEVRAASSINLLMPVVCVIMPTRAFFFILDNPPLSGAGATGTVRPFLSAGAANPPMLLGPVLRPGQAAYCTTGVSLESDS